METVYVDVRGSLHTSHLLLYPSPWLLVPRLSSQSLLIFPIQPAFNFSRGHQDLREKATSFCKLREPLHVLAYLLLAVEV